MQSVKVKLILILNSISILSILLSGTFFIYHLKQENDRQLVHYRESLSQSVDDDLRMQVEAVVSMIGRIYEEQKAGLLTEEQAKRRAADYVRDMRYDQDSYFWVDTGDGVNVVLLGRAAEGKSRIDAVDPSGKHYIQEMLANGKKDGGGYTDLMFPKPGEQTPLPKRNYTLAFTPYNWVVGTGVWVDYIDGKVAAQAEINAENFSKGLVQALLYMILAQIIVMLVAVYLGKRFAAPIVAAIEQLDHFARGDFSLAEQQNGFAKQSDEFGKMHRALLTVNQSMRQMLRKIAASSEQVASASEELTASADQSATVSGQVAESITQVAGSCSTQLSAVQNAQGKVEELSTNMEEIASNVVTSNEQIHAATEAAQKGSEDVGNAVKQMALIEGAVDNSAAVVAKLGERSKEIGTIVDTISGIAGQTNLLALNAAIEAARAGEQGRGFAVVAEEVRKLAEQSQEAAKKIAALIGEIQADTDEAVSAMHEGTAQVKVGAEVVNNAGDSFTVIASLVECIAEQSRHMEGVLGTMAMGMTDVVDAVQQIDEMSKKIASESQTVSAATEEQTASMHEIATAGQSLADMAQELQVEVHKFHV